MAIQPVDLRKIDESAANVYEAIIVSAKRARVINNENKIEFNALLSTVPNSGNEDDGEDIQNPAQLDISLEFERREKPHIEALYELLDKKVDYRYKS